MPEPLKAIELLEEWNYRRAERIAILCPEGDPTPEQIKMAETEADEAIRRLKDDEECPGQGVLF